MRSATHRKDPKPAKDSIFDTPSYTATEAAYLLKLNPSTIRAWCFGQSYKSRDGSRHVFQQVIVPADTQARLLSFSNLCELHVLGAITRGHRIPLQKARKALDYVSRELGEQRPLLAKDFITNGLELFLERAGQLVSVSGGGQIALRGEFERRLERIQRGTQGTPVRLFPFTRTSSTAIEQPTVVVIDPEIAFGRPIVASARVRTDVIRDRFAAGDSPQEMAEDYGVSADQILEAIRYEQQLAA